MRQTSLIRAVLVNNKSTNLLMLLGWKWCKINNDVSINVQDADSMRPQSDLEQPSRIGWASQEGFYCSRPPGGRCCPEDAFGGVATFTERKSLII